MEERGETREGYPPHVCRNSSHKQGFHSLSVDPTCTSIHLRNPSFSIPGSEDLEIASFRDISSRRDQSRFISPLSNQISSIPLDKFFNLLLRGFTFRSLINSVISRHWEREEFHVKIIQREIITFNFHERTKRTVETTRKQGNFSMFSGTRMVKSGGENN